MNVETLIASNAYFGFSYGTHRDNFFLFFLGQTLSANFSMHILRNYLYYVVQLYSPRNMAGKILLFCQDFFPVNQQQNQVYDNDGCESKESPAYGNREIVAIKGNDNS